MTDKEKFEEEALAEFIEITGIPKERVDQYGEIRRIEFQAYGETYELKNPGLAVIFKTFSDGFLPVLYFPTGSTTKTCRTCGNFGSHHGICEICKDYGCWTEQEPTTKNDLGVKLISKSDVDRIIDCPYFRQTDKLIQIMNLPSVTPQEPIDYKAQYERFSKKSEVVISQLRADRNRLLEVLDKLRAEIERQKKLLMIGCNAYNVNIALDTIKLVIDKYKAENEPQESEV